MGLHYGYEISSKCWDDMSRQAFVNLSDEEWEGLIHDAIKHWHQPDRLADSSLLGLRLVAERAVGRLSPVMALREVLDEAIGRLAPEEGPGPSLDRPEDPRWSDYRWRPVNILRGLTSRHRRLNADALQDLIGVAGGHYYREYERARKMVAEELRNMEGVPLERDEAPWRLEFPSGGMRVDDVFYIERAADHDLALALRQPGQTITIRGPRQVGKTSLLARGIHQAQERFGAQLVYLDFQGVGEAARQSLRDLLRAVSLRLFRALSLDLAVWERVWAYDFLPQENLQELMEYALRQVEQPIVLAMDEVDVIQLTFFSNDFFSLLRSWHNLRANTPLWRKLTLLMAISTEPYLLIDRVGESPFNIGHVLYLSDFTLHQTAELNGRYGSPLSDVDVAALHGLLNGHPYLTRVAFYTLVAGPMTWPELEARAIDENSPFHPHLQWQLRRIEDDSRLLAGVIEAVQNRPSSDPQVGYHLMKAGLVNKEGHNYVCRCELYRRYFADRLHVRASR